MRAAFEGCSQVVNRGFPIFHVKRRGFEEHVCARVLQPCTYIGEPVCISRLKVLKHFGQGKSVAGSKESKASRGETGDTERDAPCTQLLFSIGKESCERTINVTEP